MSTSATTSAPEPPKLIKKAGTGDVKNPSSSTQTHFGCQHIKSLLHANREQAVSTYTRLIQVLKRKDDLTTSLCMVGDKVHTTTETTYLCLQCPSINKTQERHAKGHAFSVESKSGFIFCQECKDFVYNPTFEEIRSNNGRKRKNTEPHAEGEKRLIATNSTITPCAATGLRGLYNMGQTCFMSVILQALIHNPIIRAFYLCEGHRKEDCEREACTSCALDDIFNDFLAQDKHEGYGAVNMLQACWKGGGTLAGYSQQDAHEFLGFILNSLHAANTGEDEEASRSESQVSFPAKENCECIIHQTFGGLLKSTVTCSSCKNITTALDPFMDLSLDIRTHPASAKPKKLKLANGTLSAAAARGNDTNSAMDLAECLSRFTSAETLSSDSYYCRNCSAPQPATKKLMLSKLPPVMPIHLKRFSHSKSSSQSSKVETKIRFPLEIDFGAYCAASSSKSKSKFEAENDQVSNGTANDGSSSKPSTSATKIECMFDLSSVIVHKGKIDNGHYISYSRQQGHVAEWFRFDDSMVVQVAEKEVLNAEAYMLFYVVRELP